MQDLLSSTHLIILFALVFFIDSLAQFLNLNTSKKPLPVSLQDMQTPAEQTRASEYLRERVVLSVVKDAFFLIVFAWFLQQGIFGVIAGAIQSNFTHPLVQALWFVAMLAFGQAILGLPFSAYSTFGIEAKYGFNRTTLKTFLGDLLKGSLIGAILGGLIFSFIVKMFGAFDERAWLVIWLGYTAFQFFLVWLAPVTLLPLFMKLSPLPEGSLKDQIEAYSQKQSFKLDGAWVCDASKRSAKSNAFFTGFGRFRRLVLFDTLIEKHPPEEIVAIVAHEAGHFKLGHIWKLSLFSAFSSLVFFYCIQQLVMSESLYRSFETAPGNLGIGLVLAGIVINKALFFISPLSSYFSRKNEFSADQFSVDTTHEPRALMNGLKRLVTENLATLQHHPLYVVLHDSHPPLPDRLKPIERQIGTPSQA